MSMILLAVEDADRDAPIRDLLTAEGWWVTTVTSKEEALRAAADHAPQLLILDRRMDDPAALIRAFARQTGGCGVLVLVDSLAEEAAGDVGDGVVSRDQETDDLVATVRGHLEAPRAAQESPETEGSAPAADEQLTARDLFGDILVDLGEIGEPDDEEDEEPDLEAAGDGDLAADEDGREGEDGSDPVDRVASETTEALTDSVDEGAKEEVSDDEGSDDRAEAEEDLTEGAGDAEEAVAAEPFEPATVEPSIEVPVPPDVAASDLLAAQAARAAEEQDDEPTVETDSEHESIDAVEPDLPQEDKEAQEATEAQAETEAPEYLGKHEGEDSGGPEDAGDEVEHVITRAADQLMSPLADLDPDDGEPTTDLMEEVADLLESPRDDWSSGDEPESGEGLSIEEVLAVEESVAASDATEEVAAKATADDDREPPEASVASEPAVDYERLGPYELLELAEFGDLTERWLARRAGSEDTVILERVRHDLRTRADVRDAFVEGNSDAAGWEHDNVLGVVDLGRDGDVDYVVTAHHPGRSLAEVLSRVERMEARMPLGVSLLLIERIAAALEVLAASPATSRHGWLVPGSIWLGEDGGVLLREFGLGRLAPSDATVLRDWTEHRFSAPEKWSHRGDVRSDLYSLGAVFYEMVTGQPIHREAGAEALASAIQDNNITSAQEVDPTIPSEIDAWVMRLLRRSPSDRPQSVQEVMAKIDLALQALPARPASAELNAYVRQLFAARVPDLPPPVVPAALEEATGDDAEADETQEVSGRRRQWWWLLIPLLALLSAFVGWKLLSGGDPVAATGRFESATPRAIAALPTVAPNHPRLQ